jgi:hypothetical protein
VIVRLEPQYNVSQTPTEPCNGGSNLRDQADVGSNYTTWKSIAQGYKRVAASLPRPPDGAPLVLQIGNELNLAWSCSCSAEAPACLGLEQMAAEAAYFSRDTLAALRTLPNVLVAPTPLAPVGARASPPCCHSSSCPHSDISATNLEFIPAMLKAVPTLWDGADWFSSHSYPCANPGCGLNHSLPGNGWNAAYEHAIPWLSNYRREVALVRPGSGVTKPVLPVIVTETGWCMDAPATQELRAEWTVRAFKELWLPDVGKGTLLAVAPFLLQGDQWLKKGFPWIAGDGKTPFPVYNATRLLRCQVIGGSDC